MHVIAFIVDDLGVSTLTGMNAVMKTDEISHYTPRNP